MNGIIVYKSKYGATKKYADWIAERTGFTCVRLEDTDVKKLMEYDVIIFGGGIYASGIAGLPFLKKNIMKLREKRIIVFCCGASPFEKGAFDAIVERNFKDDLEGLPCYYCRGVFDMPGMTFKDRTLCKMLRKAVSKKDPNEYEVWEKGLMEARDDERADWTDISYIDPIVEEVSSEVM